MSKAFAKMDWKLHSSLRIVHQSERPASWFDSRMYCLKCSGMNDWTMNYHSSLYKQKIIYESNLSWLNTIILSQKICIRNNGYNFWARDFIGEVIDSLCKLFSIWLWNQAWFKIWWALSDVSDGPITDRQSEAVLNLFKRDTIGQKLWSLL